MASFYRLVIHQWDVYLVKMYIIMIKNFLVNAGLWVSNEFFPERVECFSKLTPILE